MDSRKLLRLGISKTALALIIVIIIIIAGIAGYIATRPPAAPPTTSSPTTLTPSPTTTPTSPTPVAKKRIVIGVTDKVTDLDPAQAYDFFTWEVLNNIMGGLVQYKPGTTEIVPNLAESWEIKENGKVWVFHLRKDLKFADGTPCTAQNVVWSIKRVMKIKGDPSWLVTDFVEDVVAIDNYTVKFILKKPVSYFLALLATPPYFPVSPKYKPNEVDSDQTAGGVGPYKIVKWVRDEVLVLRANPYYFGPKPKVEEIVIKFYKDATTLRMAIETGEIDIAWRTLRPIDIESLKKNPNLNVIEVPGAYIRYIIINVKMSPTNNKLVRQAIAAAIDRKEICEKVFMNTTVPLYSLVPIGMWSHEDVFKKYGDGNIELAKKLLKEAGYSETNKLKLELWYTPTHYGDTEKDLAALIKEQLERTGMIEVTIKSAEWSTYLDYTRKGALMLSLYGWYPDYIDPDDYLTPFLRTDSNAWTGSGYSNPEVDKLLDEAAVLTDQSERAKLYKKVQGIMADEVPIIPLFQGKLYIVTKKGIKGVVLDPTMLFRYYLLYWETES
mgnify:CR=1 FL=1